MNTAADGSAGQRREATLDDVARRAGVHPSTVSRSLNPLRAGRIGAETRERVRRAARELDYQPHPGARALRSGRSDVVGVVLPDLSNPVYAMLVRGVSERLEAEGRSVVVMETHDDDERHGTALRALEARRVDAVIDAAARGRESRHLAALLQHGLPLVLAARDVAGAEIPRVLNDDLRGGALAADHLLGLGHRRLAQLSGPADVVSFDERSRGFRSRVLDSPANRPIELSCEQATVAEGRRTMQALLRRRARPTAVFAHNDLIAIGAIAAIRDAGLRCPDDVSVIGYNDMPLTEYLDPPLTTIALPATEIGRVAGDAVLSLLRGRPPAARIALQPRLVARASTSAFARGT